MAAIDWASEEESLQSLGVGCFGASTGAAAALIAAAERPDRTAAVVSRGGRPDLAGEALARVLAPTLLIVGGADEPVLELNEEARRRMSATVRLEIVPGATHLFEEPGALSRVAHLAAECSPLTCAETNEEDRRLPTGAKRAASSRSCCNTSSPPPASSCWPSHEVVFQ